MRISDEDSEKRTVFCGNLSEEVSEAVLYELFSQAGPVESVRRPREPNGRSKSFGFVVFKHECSVPFATELFKGTKLFNRTINVNNRNNVTHIPVLDTHLTEFNLQTNFGRDFHPNHQSQERGFARNRDHRNDDRHRNREQNSDRNREQNWDRNREQNSDRNREQNWDRNRERNSDEPKSWAEHNALKGKNSLLNDYQRNDLQSPINHRRGPRNEQSPSVPAVDVEALMRMGLAMVGMAGNLGGMGPNLGGVGPNFCGMNMYPSMQGNTSGGQLDSHYSQGRERDRDQGRREEKEYRRDHPYNNSNRQSDHRRHDRGYSSAHSSHDRERRNRRSR